MSDAYFDQLNAGEYRTRENYWMYLGFCSLIGIGLLTASIMEWKIDGDVMKNAMPGSDAPAETVYVTVLDGMSFELKSVMYVGVFGLMVVLLVCYVMAVK